MNNERSKRFKSSAFLNLCYPPSVIGHLPFVIRHLFLMLNHVHETPDINIGPENA